MKESGQALLIAVLIGMLLLVTIPVIVFVNMTGARNHVSSVKRDKASAIAAEGISYAMQVFSTLNSGGNPTVFPNALNGFIGNLGGSPDCNSGTDVIGADGGHFRLTCESLAAAVPFNCPSPLTCQSYEVYVKATAWLPGHSGTYTDEVPVRAMAAYLSQKTLAVSLPSGLTAPVALSLMKAPIEGTNDEIDTFYGPVVSYDPNPWTLDTMMDWFRLPRKFSVGGISGTPGNYLCGNMPCYIRDGNPATSNPPTTDQKEYWGYTSVGFPAIINLTLYSQIAQNTVVPQPSCITAAGAPDGPLSPLQPSLPQCAVASCGYFDASQCPAGDLILFDGGPNIQNTPSAPFAGYSVSNPNGVIYVNGNAQFQHVTIDVHPAGAVIVNGNIILADHRNAGGWPNQPWPCPPTRALDDPYQRWPGDPCPLWNPWDYDDIQGFLYATGNLTVNFGASPIAGQTYWVIPGVVRVDNQLTLATGSVVNDLVILYDDIVNRNIRTMNFQLMIDSQREVPAT